MLWGLLLPVTVSSRVSDIWRSYAAQRLMWLCGQQLAFSAPWVEQIRNAHNYLADFAAEGPLYSQAGELVRYLREWKPPASATTLRDCVLELTISLYEIGVLEESDIHLQRAWLHDLQERGYVFPALVSRSSTGDASGGGSGGTRG